MMTIFKYNNSQHFSFIVKINIVLLGLQIVSISILEAQAALQSPTNIQQAVKPRPRRRGAGENNQQNPAATNLSSTGGLSAKAQSVLAPSSNSPFSPTTTAVNPDSEELVVPKKTTSVGGIEFPTVVEIAGADDFSSKTTGSAKDLRDIVRDTQDTQTTKNTAPDDDDSAEITSPADDVEELEDEEQKHLSNYAYLGEFLKPWEFIHEDKTLDFNFENADLLSFIKYIEKEFGLTFILPNALSPVPQGAGNLSGIKFSFKSQHPLSKKQAWDIFLTFLDMAGLTAIPGPSQGVYQITTTEPNSRFSPTKSALPLFINVDASLLPIEGMIRYIYFIQNASSKVISSVIEQMQSPQAGRSIIIDDLGALLLTDKASNIRTILEVIKELDKPIMPETLSIVKLGQADATIVKTLYDNLVNEERALLSRLSPGGKKQSSIAFFTENVRVIPYKRTNSLIILGPRANVRKIEDFIRREIDKDIDLPYSPLHVYMLKFIDAESTASILNELKQVQPTSATAQAGGVLGGTKYLSPTVTITSEKLNNALIINADYDDYLQIYDLLQKIDVEQPQVAIRVLVLDINLEFDKAFGTQIRNRKPTLNGVLSDEVNFQTSGLPLSSTSLAPIVQRTTIPGTETPAPGSIRLLGDLINLAAANVAGSTVVTLGDDIYGVWGIFKVLQSFTDVSVVARPFLVTTHKYPAQLKIQDIRRVQTSTVTGGSNVQQDTFGDLEAGININITPLISPDGLVTLTVYVENSQFTTPATSNDISAGNTNSKTVSSSAIVADNQVLALGGLKREALVVNETKTPILGDIPLVGWLFKNRTQIKTETTFLVLISAEIIQPTAQERIEYFTQQHVNQADQLLCKMQNDEQLRDPISRWFFDDDKEPYRDAMRSFARPNVSTKKSSTTQGELRESARATPSPSAGEILSTTTDQTTNTLSREVTANPVVPPAPEEREGTPDVSRPRRKTRKQIRAQKNRRSRRRNADLQTAREQAKDELRSTSRLLVDNFIDEATAYSRHNKKRLDTNLDTRADSNSTTNTDLDASIGEDLRDSIRADNNESRR